MHTIYRIVLTLHVLGGGLGLCCLALPLIAKKGARFHRMTGWLFTGGMGLSAVTGIVMAGSWMLAPEVFQPASTALEARLDGMFLGLIGVLTGNALIQAVSAVRRKHSHARPGLFTRLSLVALTLAASCSIALGATFNEMLPLVFGIGSLALAAQDALFTLRPLSSPMAWWYQHMNAMGTACISAVTAFVVVGGRRWLGDDLLGDHVWMLWIAPSVLLVPLFQGWIVMYRRKFATKQRQRAGVAVA